MLAAPLFKQQEESQAIEAAILTIRKSACFGRNTEPLDFEWPKPNDLRQMSKKSLIKLAKLNYKICSSKKIRFGAFQVIL
jgi:hypothetical protein